MPSIFRTSCKLAAFSQFCLIAALAAVFVLVLPPQKAAFAKLGIPFVF